ncbi:hypothetical protein GCM10009425_32480 [Pseudomonas asuensis]|uniref:Uncharacterized protein n=1 Tax=Pseudomonas asuensis TaxID=1825787 RepID=A0ABQ2GZP3_9PSED|nr:hypothetical protein GCM10009425_32480 [Pseudomonas asuensis]
MGSAYVKMLNRVNRTIKAYPAPSTGALVIQVLEPDSFSEEQSIVANIYEQCASKGDKLARPAPSKQALFKPELDWLFKQFLCLGR